MTLADLISEIEQKAADIVFDMNETTAEELGLDGRAGSRLYASEEGIAVPTSMDRVLQYYGGFEYVDANCRVVLGDYVFYTADARRVSECLERLEWA